jgi:hypothetical protein
MLDRIDFDLFWNSASFQEMEPEVVLNYLGPVNRRARGVFLREVMEGWRVARRPGTYGVLTPTTLDHYTRALSNFHLVDLSASALPHGPSSIYSDSFWERSRQ